VQLFVPAQEDVHYFSIQDDRAYVDALARLVAFDVIVNNADRKSGHCLADHDGHLWAIDNALTFHVEPKLRTVIWDFAGQALPNDVRSHLKTLEQGLERGDRLSRALEELLSGEEIDAFQRRVRRLAAAGRFPEPGPGRVVPWPMV
jgi:uncharacterized repeat protein (TIGR03843 family)